MAKSVKEATGCIFIFRYVQPHSKVPNLKGWYWYISSVLDFLVLCEKVSMGPMADTINEYTKRLQKNAERAEQGKQGTAGHWTSVLSHIMELKIQDKFKDGDMIGMADLAVIAEKTMLAPKLKILQECGAIYVGPNLIGFMEDSGQKVLNEVVTKEFKFPIDNEIITVGKWPGGKHYYLTSTAQREFPDKFNSSDEAENHALQFVNEDQIEFKSQFRYMREGD